MKCMWSTALGTVLLAGLTAVGTPEFGMAQASRHGPVFNASLSDASWVAPGPPAAVPLSVEPEYRANHWKTGLLVGAGVGVLLGGIVLASCDRDSNSDCPGWGRAAVAVGVGTGLGALIGALIPRKEVPEATSAQP